MRRLFLLLSFGFGLIVFGLGVPNPARAQRPADDPAHTAPDFVHLRPAIAALPDSGRIDQLREFSDVMVESGQFGEAQAALDEALAIGQAADDPALVSKAEASLGYLAASQAQFPAAIQHYQRAYDLIKHTTAYSRQAKILMRIGSVFVEAKDWGNAERYLHQALTVAKRHQLSAQMAGAYDGLSNLAGMRQRPAEAMTYIDSALVLHQAAQNWDQYYGTLLNQAICYKNLGQYEQSARAYRQIITYAQEQHDDYLLNYVYANFPNTLLLLHQPAEAERYALRGVVGLANAPNQAMARKEIYDVLTRVKEAQGDYRQALRYHRLSAAYADTVLNAEKAKQLIDAETRYQTKEKQARIARLDDDNARQARQLWALGFGATALAVLLVIAIAQYRVIRRTNARLHATNQQVLDRNHHIQEQATRLTMLMKELHHRVKNNLAIVSGLLRLQANRLTDAGAVKAVRESQQRVEAMAFIHQRLYQTDDVTTVDMRRYVTDLAESLLTAYGHDLDQFDLELDVDHPPLEVDLAVPLGLILNELLTNSLKYAYADVAHPRLRIYLGAAPDQPAALLLEVHDNGPGIDPAQWGQSTRSFGQRLIASLSEQVGGHLEISNRAGAHCRLLIPLTTTATVVPTPAPVARPEAATA